MEQIQLLQEEIDQLKNLQSFQTQLINNQENELGLQLTQKYGDGSIDLTSGLFTKSN